MIKINCNTKLGILYYVLDASSEFCFSDLTVEGKKPTLILLLILTLSLHVVQVKPWETCFFRDFYRVLTILS